MEKWWERINIAKDNTFKTAKKWFTKGLDSTQREEFNTHWSKVNNTGQEGKNAIKGLNTLRRQGKAQLAAERALGDSSRAITTTDGPKFTAEGVSKAATALQMFTGAGRLLDTVTGLAGINIDQVNQNSAERAGFGAANKANNFISKIPGANFVMSFGATNITNANESAYRNTLGSGYTGSFTDVDAAKELGGKRMLIGAEKAKAFVDTSNAQVATMNRIGQQSEMARQNDVASLYQAQSFNKYSGHSPSLLVKNGIKFPELEDIKKHLLLKGVKKLQLGGKITSNYIPEGALHRNKHHITDNAPELDGQITEKGIPVISDQNGEITQHAEIEGNELTLSLPTTKQLEAYYAAYKENPSDEILVECGKYFVQELLQNTEDPGKLIKEV